MGVQFFDSHYDPMACFQMRMNHRGVLRTRSRINLGGEEYEIFQIRRKDQWCEVGTR